MEKPFQAESMGKSSGLPGRQPRELAPAPELGHEQPPTYRHYLALKDFGSQRF